MFSSLSTLVRSATSAVSSTSPSTLLRITPTLLQSSLRLTQSLRLFATTPQEERPVLVTADWVEQNLDSITPVDASWYSASSGRNAREEFQTLRLPNARYLNKDAITDSRDPRPNMLCDAKNFEAQMDSIGVSRDDHVVLYDSRGVFISPRIWWAFKVFGHPNVSILNGGLPAWMEGNKRKLETTPTNQTYEKVGFGYKAEVNNDLVSTLDDIVKNCEDCKCQVFDARSSARFHGTSPEPFDGLKGGHIPKSLNLPFEEVLTSDGLYFKPKEELLEVFKNAGVDQNRPVIMSCGSGLTAAIVYFALAYVGHPKLSLYDGSWVEYGKTDLPYEL